MKGFARGLVLKEAQDNSEMAHWHGLNPVERLYLLIFASFLFFQAARSLFQDKNFFA